MYGNMSISSDAKSVPPTARQPARVGRLPTDGRRLYVRLRFLIGKAWQQLDVQYTASRGGKRRTIPRVPKTIPKKRFIP